MLDSNNWNSLTVWKQIFIIQRVKARAIPCPHQPPSRGDNSFGSSRRYCHPWRYQAAFATGQGIKRIIYIYIYIYIYIHTPDQLNAETTLDVNLHFLSAVCDLKNAFTFGGWCYNAFTVTVSYVITREGDSACITFMLKTFSLSTKSNLMHIAPWSEDDSIQ